jgi:D-alanyl-D-alanine carboxypeptidase/D-alanyl-D-alanine-endopeptidase (penicillin-binding protein 4)
MTMEPNRFIAGTHVHAQQRAIPPLPKPAILARKRFVAEWFRDSAITGGAKGSDSANRQPTRAGARFFCREDCFPRHRLSVIFEQDANKFVRPASNMKLYTCGAFDRLTPDYRFITSVHAKEKVEDGKIKGDLIIYGRGDPSIGAARFNNGDYSKASMISPDRIVAAGVTRVKGDLVGDESYFNGESLGSGWEWQDLQWSYGAPVSALSINDNAVDLTVRPGARIGSPVVVSSGPPSSGFITTAIAP